MSNAHCGLSVIYTKLDTPYLKTAGWTRRCEDKWRPPLERPERAEKYCWLSLSKIYQEIFEGEAMVVLRLGDEVVEV